MNTVASTAWGGDSEFVEIQPSSTAISMELLENVLLLHEIQSRPNRTLHRYCYRARLIKEKVAPANLRSTRQA